MTPKNLASVAIGAAVLAAVLYLSGDFALFFNPAGLLLVLGGTAAGLLLAFPLETIRGLLDQIHRLSAERLHSTEELVERFVSLALLQRREGVRALEAEAEKSGNFFLAMGCSMVADAAPRAEVQKRLEQEYDLYLSRCEAQRAVLSLAGRLAPAFGLAGTMVGLIRMLNTLSEPSSVAAGMSVALLSTFYGLMLANLLVLPLERKLAERTRAEALEMTLIAEGVIGLAEGEGGAAIDARLHSYRLARPGRPAHRGAPWRELGAHLKGLLSPRAPKPEHRS